MNLVIREIGLENAQRPIRYKIGKWTVDSFETAVRLASLVVGQTMKVQYYTKRTISNNQTKWTLHYN
jgi:hypothetical protein